MRPLLFTSLLAVSLACSAGASAGSRAPGSAGGDGGGAGGPAGGAGGDGATGGAGGEPCSNPALCWIEEDAGWIPVPGLDPARDPCTLDSALAAALPATSLRWEPCGDGCERSTLELVGAGDEVADARSLGRIEVDGRPTAVAQLSSRLGTGLRDWQIERLVRLSDGATLGAIRGGHRPGEQAVLCGLEPWGGWGHPRHFVLHANWAYGADTGFYVDAIWQPATPGWSFGVRSLDAPGFRPLSIAAGDSPALVTLQEGRVELRRELASPDREILDEGPGIAVGAGDETRVAWATPGAAPNALVAWRPADGARNVTTLPGTIRHLAVGDDGIFADLVEGDDRSGYASHRIWSGARDGSGGTSAPLLGGTPLAVVAMSAGGDFVAFRAGFGDDKDVLLVVRRSDGLARLLRPAGRLRELVVDDASLYATTLAGTEPEASLYRYDLSRFELLGDPP